jgi:hypothetical protein
VPKITLQIRNTVFLKMTSVLITSDLNAYINIVVIHWNLQQGIYLELYVRSLAFLGLVEGPEANTETRPPDL